MREGEIDQEGGAGKGRDGREKEIDEAHRCLELPL